MVAKSSGILNRPVTLVSDMKLNSSPVDVQIARIIMNLSV